MSALARNGLPRPLAFGALLTALALAFALAALAASPAKAGFQQTGSWDVPAGGNSNSRWVSHDIAANSSGDVFTGLDRLSLPPSEIDKWDADGNPGAPALFGDTFTPTSRYAGLATHPVNGNLYALLDYDAPSTNAHAAIGTGDRVSGNATITNVVTTGGAFEAGMPIAGTGIPAATTILSIDGGTGDITLSAAATSTGSGTFRAGSPTVAIFQPDGTPVDDFPVATGGDPVGIDVDDSGNVYVPDPSSGVVRKYGPAGALLDTTAGSALNDPADVGVDSAGNLYVADRSTNPVNEEQSVDLHGATGGTLRLCFEGDCTGGDLTGDTSYAEGNVDIARANGTVDTHLLASGTGDLTAGSATVTDVVNAGDYTVGESIASGTNQNNILFGTTIDAIDAGNDELTLSQPAQATVDNANLASGDRTVDDVANAGDYEVGMTIVQGNGIGTSNSIPLSTSTTSGTPTPPFATTVTAVDDVAGTLTLSVGAIAATDNASVIASGLTDLNTTDGEFEVGQRLLAPVFNFGFAVVRVTEVDPVAHTLTVASVASSAVTDQNITAGSDTITDVQLAPGTHLSHGVGPLTGAGLASDAGVRRYDQDNATLLIDGVSIAELGVDAKGDDVGFSQGMLFSTGAIGSTLESLPGIGVNEFDGDTSFPNDPFGPRTENASEPGTTLSSIPFVKAMGGRDVPELTCDGSNLTGTTPANTCSVSTTTPGSSTPGRVAKFDSSLDFDSNFIPPAGSYTAEAIEVDQDSGDVYVADGNSSWRPIGGQATSGGPTFAVRRYDSGGSQQGDPIGFGTLAASEIHNHFSHAVSGPAFGLDFDPSTQTLYTVGVNNNGGADGFENGLRSTVNAFTGDHPLTVTVNGNGNGTVDADSGAIAACDDGGGANCTDDYLFGATVTLTATPGAESTTSWAGCDSEPSADECEVTVDGVEDVTATFTLNQYALNVAVDGSGTGSVTSDVGSISCDENNVAVDCTDDYDFGTLVTLTAAPGPSATTGWAGCDNVPSADVCEVTVDGVEDVTATFNLDQYSLTVNHAGTGASTVEDGAPGGIQGCTPSAGTCVGNYDDLGTVTLTATPNANHELAGWTGCDDNPTPTTCEVTFAGDDRNVQVTTNEILHDLDVTVDGNGNGTVTSAPAGINCDQDNQPDCSETYVQNTAVTLTAAPGAESTTSWAGCDNVPSANECEVDMATAENVTATFTLNTYDLDVTVDGDGTGAVTSAPAGIDCDETQSPDCSETYDFGTVVTLTAAPDANQEVSGWAGCDSNPTAQTCEVTVNGAESVTATIDQITHNVSVTKSGTGAGDVTSDTPPINCGATCSGQYDQGTPVVLTATPALHSSFEGWTGCDSVAGDECTVNVDAAENVDAQFDLIFHDLNVSHDGSGSGAVDADFGAISNCTPTGGTCTDNLVEGAIITLTATADSGSTFEGWAGCTNSSGNTCTVELNAPTNVTATFDEIPEDPGDDDNNGGGGGGGGGGSTTPPDDTPEPQAGIAVAGRAAQVRGRVALVRMRCAGQGACRGQARLIARVVTRRVIRRGNRRRVVRKPRNLIVGRSAFAIGQGQGGVVRVRLTGQGLRLVRRARRGLRVRIVGPGLRNKALVLKAQRQRGSNRNRNRNRR